uniref:Peptidase S1 domain-containing protein n=1 Tax=Glossina brevipalpis TaxID=37001 RepID=A0A1A9WPB6_9MUSC
MLNLANARVSVHAFEVQLPWRTTSTKCYFPVITHRNTLLDNFLTAAICRYVKGCVTPFGGLGKKMRFSECEIITKLLLKYQKDLPPIVHSFIETSFVTPEDIENVLRKNSCCPTKEIDTDKVFKNVGAEILSTISTLCGDNTHKRISFGEQPTFMAYPWAALLIYDDREKFQCGGTLITQRYVLTAAHCIKDNLVGIRLREYNISSEEDCAADDGYVIHCMAPAINLGIEKIIKHERFSKFNFENDIALIRLPQSLEYERSIRPVCLPERQNAEYFNNYGVISGWGLTEKGKISDVLLHAEVPVLSLDYCRKIYRYNHFNSTKICASGVNEIDICKGDSGGPLVARLEGYHVGRKFRYLQTGIISAGISACGDERSLPGVFTDVASYIDWIEEKLEL